MSCQQKFKVGDKFRRLTPHKSQPCNLPAGYVGVVRGLFDNGKSISDGENYHNADNLALIQDNCAKFRIGDVFIRIQASGHRSSGTIGYKSTVARVTDAGIYDTSGNFHIYASIQKNPLNLDCQIAETEKKLEELRAAKVAAERPEIKVGQVWKREGHNYRVVALVKENLNAPVVFFFTSEDGTRSGVYCWSRESVYNTLKLKDDCGC